MEEKKNYLFITGASSGIGRQVAIGLSDQYNLILSGRNSSRLSETRSLCSGSSRHLILDFDLTRSEELEGRVSEFMMANNLEVSSFVHCAGCMKLLPLKMVNLDAINMTFRTNIFAALLLTKVFTQKKINGEALKSIVYISSNISNFGAKAFSIYGASKGSLDALMRNLAVELAPRVRVNSVLPGAIHTEMTNSIFENEETVARMKATYPLGLGAATDIVDAVRFLLSDQAKWITGQQLTVDGGRTINITG